MPQETLSLELDSMTNSMAAADSTSPAQESRQSQPLRAQAGTNAPAYGVDGYAAQLMDELFSNVDHLLETGAELPQETPDPEVLSIQPLSLPQVSLPVALVRAAEVQRAQVAAQESAVQQAEAIARQAEDRRSWRLTHWLAGATLLALLGAAASIGYQRDRYVELMHWAMGQSRPADSLSQTGSAALPPSPPLSPNQAFAQYISRALDRLASQRASATVATIGTIALPPLPTQASASALPSIDVPSAPTATSLFPGLGTPGTTPGTTPVAGLPPTASTAVVSTPGNPNDPSSSASGQTVLERVYIPVYQTPQGFVPVVPGLSQAPAQTTAPASTPSSSQASSQASTQAPRSSQPQAVAARPAPAATGTAPAATAAAAPTTPVVSHTLVGLLELGEKSAALFEYNGVTRRINVGERIGSSGWTLVEVKSQEALVRRNGEVRSLFVGQVF